MDINTIFNNGVAVGVLLWFMFKHDRTLSNLNKSIMELGNLIKEMTK